MIRRSYCAHALLSSVALAALPFFVHAESTANLLTNPGAESGNLTGWTQGGTSSPTVDNGSGHFASDGIFPFQGSFDFVGGTGSSGTLTQNIGFSGFAPTFQQLDNKQVTFTGSFFECSFNSLFVDTATVNASFLNASSGVISATANPALTNLNWTATNYNGTLPSGTRQISYAMQFNRLQGSDLDAFIDSNSITVTYPGSSYNGSASAKWSDPIQWKSGVPIAGVPALLTNPSSTASVVTFDGNYAAAALSELYVDGHASVTLNQSANTMSAANEWIGNVGTGVYNQSGGSNFATQLVLGNLAGSNGTYTLSNGSLTTQSLTVGAGGTASFTASGNTTVSGGVVSLTNSTTNLGGASFTATSLTINSAATLNITTGAVGAGPLTVNANGNLNISAGQVTTGILSLNASTAHASFSNGTLNASNLSITNGAAFNWTGGTLHITSDFTFDTLGANYILNPGMNFISNGSLTFNTAASSLTKLAGGNVSAANTSISAINGTLSVAAGSTITTTNLYVGGTPSGATGNSTLTINSGTVSTSLLTVYPSGIINLNAGGSLSLSGFTLGALNKINWNGGTLGLLYSVDINPSFPLGANLNLTASRFLSATNLTNSDAITIDATSGLTAGHLSNDFGATISGAGFIHLNILGNNNVNVGTYTFNGSLQSNGNFINFGAFTQTGPQTWAANTTFTNNSGNATFGSDTGSAISSPLAIIVTGGAVTLATTQHLNALSITSGQTVISAGTTLTNTIALGGSLNNWSGNLEIGSNKLVVENTAATKSTTLATLQNEIAFGLSHPAGITSASLPAHTALAVIDNGSLATPFTNFGGISVDANSLLLAPELLGDVNIDGRVDLTDLSTVLNNFGTTTSAWTSGNFDNATNIDLTDISTVLNNFGLTYANFSSQDSGLKTQASPTPTPEPASLLFLTFATPLLLPKRRS